jgi:flagellar biosynthesis protein FliR
MPVEALAAYLKLPVFALVAARIGGLLLFQPILGALSIPMTVRSLFILGLAALLTPLVPLPAQVPDTPLGLTLALGSEILIGALLGLLCALCFIGLQMGGLLVAQEVGVAFGQIVDPNTEDEETIHGVFYLQLVAVIYLIVGGHRAVVTACLDTFERLPLLSINTPQALSVELLARALTLSGEIALRVAGPILLTLFLVNLALGLVSRTMPQLNVLAVGFSLKGLIAFAVMAAALPLTVTTFLHALDQTCRWVHECLVAPTGG